MGRKKGRKGRGRKLGRLFGWEGRFVVVVVVVVVGDGEGGYGMDGLGFGVGLSDLGWGGGGGEEGGMVDGLIGGDE